MDQHFLKEDQEAAEKQKLCILSLCLEVSMAIYNGAFDKAEEDLRSGIASVNELKRLQDKKIEHDHMAEMVASLQSKGIPVEMVRMLANG